MNTMMICFIHKKIVFIVLPENYLNPASFLVGMMFGRMIGIPYRMVNSEYRVSPKANQLCSSH